MRERKQRQRFFDDLKTACFLWLLLNKSASPQRFLLLEHVNACNASWKRKKTLLSGYDFQVE